MFWNRAQAKRFAIKDKFTKKTLKRLGCFPIENVPTKNNGELQCYEKFK